MRIRGISLRLHPTWFVVLALLTVLFAQEYQHILGAGTQRILVWAVALATVLLLFLSVLLHEFGHSFVALSQGVKVRSITLFFLGGVANTESECRTARGEFLMAAAGPAVSLVLGMGLLLLQHRVVHLSPALGEMTLRLGMLNLMLALFNLLPGLPLDGGRIVKAIVWQVTGSQLRGVEVANALGRFLSLLALGLGIWLLLRNSGSGLWLLLLGWLGLGASRGEQQRLMLQRLLGEMQVRDVAKRRYRVLEAREPLRAVTRLRLTPTPSITPAATPAPTGMAAGMGAMAEGTADWLLVCDRGRWVGVIDDEPLRQLPVQRWDDDRVRDHMRPLSSLPAIADTAPLWQAVLALEQAEPPRLLVLSPAGLPCGTVDRPDLGEAVLTRLGVRLPEAFLVRARQQNAYPLGLALGSVARTMAEAQDAAAAKSASAPPPTA
ncbi:MAG: site-2 protease family protein [Cyanobacteriota bacterium]|nr:site-2 protease family protein [Cyanobacteriota bacterium]